MPRVKLNEAELDQWVKAAALHQETNKGATWVESLIKSQESLFPPEQRYSRKTIYNVSTDLNKRMVLLSGKILVNPLFEGKHPGFNEPGKSSTVSGFTPTQDQKPAGFSPLKSIPGPDPVKPKPQFPQIPSVNKFTFGDKITELASCLAKQFETQLTTELETALSAALGNVERSFSKKLEEARKITGSVKKHLPRVAVIGVMGDVAFQTESEYGEMLDLRFYKQEESLSLVRAQAKHCDYVILITGHINHGHQDCVREHPGLIFCSGGVTQMKEILLTLACK